jgi:hypothetical protein
MADSRPTLEVKYAIVCDDIRTEDNGKDIIIGVYNDKILVRSFPAALALSLWLHILPTKVGEHPLHSRLLGGPADAVFFSGKGTLSTVALEVSSLAFVGLNVLAKSRPNTSSRSGSRTRRSGEP